MPHNIHPYQRLQTELAEIISKTPSGERLISEPALAKQLGVSRATLREAMRAFEGQGLIRRRQGIGTFVVDNEQVIESGLEVLQSIEGMAKKIGLDVSLGEMQIKQNEADEFLAKEFKVLTGTPLIHVERVISAKDRPVAFLIDILPESILTPEELEPGFTGSVLDILLKRGTPPLQQSRAEIQAVAASSTVARYLEIQRGDVLLKLTAWLFDESGNVVDFSKSYFLPGYFKFHVNRRVGPLSMPESN